MTVTGLRIGRQPPPPVQDSSTFADYVQNLPMWDRRLLSDIRLLDFTSYPMAALLRIKNPTALFWPMKTRPT
jgi:hypothetical protein